MDDNGTPNIISIDRAALAAGSINHLRRSYAEKTFFEDQTSLNETKTTPAPRTLSPTSLTAKMSFTESSVETELSPLHYKDCIEKLKMRSTPIQLSETSDGDISGYIKETGLLSKGQRTRKTSSEDKMKSYSKTTSSEYGNIDYILDCLAGNEQTRKNNIV